MAPSFFSGAHNKPLNQERSKRRIHYIVPWIKNPLQGVDKESLVFSPRHEANTLELFFDLFFVANLALFTAYHAINGRASIWAYIGFFVAIWITWFHVTLHDVRFAHDTIYERVCKTIQMITFVGFALVAINFHPGSTRLADNGSFRTLCYCLFMSRALLVIQYSVVAIFVAKARRKDVILPLFLNILIYLLAAISFLIMLRAFPDVKKADAHNKAFVGWWVIMSVEIIATIGISSIWRMLSFKKTHLVERMQLLTLIVIGEGAIGVTKTVGRVMGKGLYPEGAGLVLCVILILMALWMIYFDNKPHGHFGTIRQQIWSTYHFVLHLAIVGVVEGAQQITLARYIGRAYDTITGSIVQACFKDHLAGAQLVQRLNASTIQYWKLESKLASLIWVGQIEDALYRAGNDTTICGPNVNGTRIDEAPATLQYIGSLTTSAVYGSLGVHMPLNEDIIEVILESWRVVYYYFWSAFLVLMVCFIVHMVLVRKNKIDVFDFASIAVRAAGAIASAVFLALSQYQQTMFDLLEAPYMLPIATAILFVVIISDRISAMVANKLNRQSYEPLAEDQDPSHGHEHAGHGDNKEHGPTANTIPLVPVNHPGLTPWQGQALATTSSYSAPHGPNQNVLPPQDPYQQPSQQQGR